MNEFKFRVWDELTQSFKYIDLKGGDCLMRYMTPQLSSGKRSKYDSFIFQGDIVKLDNKSEHIRKEYWFPIFEVTWNGFEFGLKHLGGGKCGDSNLFTFRHYSNNFEVIGNIFESTIIIPKK